MVYLLLYKLGSLIAQTFPLRLVYGLAALVGEAEYRLNGRLRRAVRHNLAQVLGPQVRRRTLTRTARRVFRNFSYNVADLLRTPQLTPEAMQAAMEVEGWTHMERAYQSGRGVVMMSAHFGNWEWGGMMVSQRGLRVNAVALDHRTPEVTRFFDALRQAQGIRTLPVQGSLFAIMKALRRGEVVAIMADRDVAHQGMPARFFDRTTLMPRAHASIATKTGALIVPAFMERQPSGRFVARFLPPLEPDELLHDEHRVEKLVAHGLAIIEAQIRAHPDQWLVFEPIWFAGKAPPDPEAREAAGLRVGSGGPDTSGEGGGTLET